MRKIEVQHVYKHYGSVEAVKDVSFTLERGKSLVIVGPSGSGKTSLLRMIAGLEKISDGRILFDGQVMNEVQASKRNVAMIFQDAALFEETRVYENIAYGLTYLGYTKEKIALMVEEVADVLHIGHLLDRYPCTLSGGEKKRVSIARALVRRPSILLLDEPFSSLDPLLQKELRKEIRALQRKYEMTMVFVSHNQEDAMYMGDVVAVMKDGRLLAMDSYAKLYEHPNCLFVGMFLGKPMMNVRQVDFVNGKVSLFNGVLDVGNDVSGSYIIGIRPQHISICEDGLYRLCVSSCVFEEGRFVLECDGWTLYSDKEYAVGDAISFAMDAEYVRLFVNE